VTGANRGLGRGVAAELLRRGYVVVVAARDPGQAAADLSAGTGGEAVPFRLDVRSDEDAVALGAFLRARSDRVDALVNNAAVLLDRRAPLAEEPRLLLDSLDANTVGAFRVTRAVAPLLGRGSTVTNVSSEMGQLSDLGSGFLGYRVSKVALNALTVLLHHELSPRGVKVNAVCPGWVRTDMGGANAPRSLAEGVRSITWAATLDASGPSGGFFRDGQRLDW
jgi:NAD(P)-dependent dehydrogenase (short-subunit alcohol dehydrogenase family)